MTLETVSEIEYAPCGEITIAYETFGDLDGVPVLLVMGLGGQMLAWPDGFCELLASRGNRVIRFDNRDIGLSTHLSTAASGTVYGAFVRRHAPYLISDMADDARRLIDHLGVASAHVVGLSMGGCISQALVLEHPTVARSLTLMSSSTGSRWVGRPQPDVVRRMLTRRPARSRDEAIEQALSMWRRIGSPAYRLNEERIRRLAGQAYDRSYDPSGGARQLAAILASPDRSPLLSRISVPTLVIHGVADPLIGVSGGRALATLIPEARLLTYPGMGHDMPEQLWPSFVDEICDVISLGEKART